MAELRTIAQSPTRKNELKSLQILRAIAAISVVYYHINAIPNFGTFGVDIFFVLSGFVIAMVLANRQPAYLFALNRIIRIVPLYWTLTTLLLAIALIAPQLLNSTTANFYNYAKSLFFIPYFKENGTLRPVLAVGWSLNYEMFFYLCVWTSILITKRHYLKLSCILVTLAYALFGFYSENRVVSAFFSNAEILEFLLGICAFKVHTSGYFSSLPKVIPAAIAIASYLFMIIAETLIHNLNELIVYGIPSFFLLLSMLNMEEIFSKPGNLAVDLFTSMGDASYATYLSHYYIIEAMRKIIYQKFDLINPYTPMGVLLILILSLLLGQLLYKFVDKPLLKFFKIRILPTTGR